MAEKKVSGRKASMPKGNNITPREAKEKEIYNDFLEQYGSSLRKRFTRTVNEPEKHTDTKSRRMNAKEARCEEVDPRPVVNPTSQHQIQTKRIGRVMSDDTGFKAESYNQRFELKPELPVLESIIPEDDLGLNLADGIPGQQTMADIVSDIATQDDISVPVESQINTSDEDIFGNIYERLKSSHVSPEIGKSEKLKAIARTAADDAEMAPDGQLSFPSFEPLFKFPEEKKPKKTRDLKQRQKHKNKNKNKKQKVQEPIQESFDIDESSLVTRIKKEKEPEIENQTDEIIQQPEPDDTAAEDTKIRRRKLFDVISSEKPETGSQIPVNEINSKSDIKNISRTLSSVKKSNFIKVAGISFFGILLLIISFIFDSKASDDTSPARIYCAISFLFVVIATAFSFKDIKIGIHDFGKLKFSPEAGCVTAIVVTLLQTIIAFFGYDEFPGSIHLLAPVAILSLLSVPFSKIILSNNAQSAINPIASAEPVSVLRTAADSGIDGVVKEKLVKDGGYVRYSSKANFLTGLMKTLTNAIPKQFGGNAAFVITVLFSVITGIAGWAISSSFITGFSAFTAMTVTCLPASYMLTASFILFKENRKAYSHRSSLISYRNAEQLSETKAMIFDANDIIEQSSCLIHGVKSFGRTDAKKAVLYAASLIVAADSPLRTVMTAATENDESTIPEAINIDIVSGKGIRATVEYSNVLLGSSEFLSENGVLIRSEELEKKFITGDRKALYLAINGEFSMMLIVSYHIKRSVLAFFRDMIDREIKITVNSSDPNVNASYITRKCKLKENSVEDTDDTQFSYFRDKLQKTENALPADVFSDGKIASVSEMFRSAYFLKKFINLLPSVLSLLTAVCAALIAVPALTGNIYAVSNLYIIILKLLSVVLGTALCDLLSKH